MFLLSIQFFTGHVYQYLSLWQYFTCLFAFYRDFDLLASYVKFLNVIAKIHCVFYVIGEGQALYVSFIC